MLEHEHNAWATGRCFVAGVDEAGRGPLAGPVTAAAVYIEKDFLQREATRALAGITDSKKLTPAKREKLFEQLHALPAVHIACACAEVEEITRTNILAATHAAMARALATLSPPPDFALIDGLPVRGLPCPHTAIVKGDSASLSIAAASIIAKVTRDRRMAALDADYPEYGFRRHKGYGTPAHLAALRKYGPCPQHRPTFAPIRQLTLF